MSGTTTAMGDVIDALLALFASLPECADPVVVTDGIVARSVADDIVSVGGMAAPTVTSSTDFEGLGHPPQVFIERFDVMCSVWCARYGGSDDGTQKAARDAALTIYKAIQKAIADDPCFAAYTPSGGPLVNWAIAIAEGIEQMPPDHPDAGKGRYAEVPFKVHVFNRIQL